MADVDEIEEAVITARDSGCKEIALLHCVRGYPAPSRDYNLKTISDIPEYVYNEDFPKEIDIRGEVFIQNSDFKNIKDKFANPRNAASGSLRQKDPSATSKIPL